MKPQKNALLNQYEKMETQFSAHWKKRIEIVTENITKSTLYLIKAIVVHHSFDWVSHDSRDTWVVPHTLE